jgi:hypothetical protein
MEKYSPFKPTKGVFYMIINRRQMARDKLQLIRQGYSAYAENKEVCDYIEKELSSLNMPVRIERTPLGCWFIPEVEKEGSRD